jgi:hypothetical protein
MLRDSGIEGSKMANRAPYRDRRTWLIDVADIAGLKMKVYGICADGLAIEPSTVAAANSFIENQVDFDDDASHGFAMLHHGEEAMWLLVDWWVEDILHQRLFCAPLEDVGNFQVGPPNHELACVWELPVIAHERDAWVKHTMVDPASPDYDAYIKDTFSIG